MNIPTAAEALARSQQAGIVNADEVFSVASITADCDQFYSEFEMHLEDAVRKGHTSLRITALRDRLVFLQGGLVYRGYVVNTVDDNKKFPTLQISWDGHAPSTVDQLSPFRGTSRVDFSKWREGKFVPV